MVWRFDGAFGKALGAISNSVTGMGTARDKTQAVEINCPNQFTQIELDNLYRVSKICQRAVDLLPEDSATTPPIWKMPKGSSTDSDAIVSYLHSIPRIPRGIQGKGNLLDAFTEAGILGRKYGDGYIVLNIDDGREWSEPVDVENIREIISCAVFDRWTLQPKDARRSQLYRVTLAERNQDLENGLLIHNSRVLSIPGKRLSGDAFYQNNGFNDSIFQAMLAEFSLYAQGNHSAGAMLADHSIFKYKMSGLSRMVDMENEQQLTSRLSLMLRGLSVIKGLILDADLEDAEFINKSYGGVKDVLEALKDCLASSVDMPRVKLFGSPATGALSEAGLSERYEWRDAIQRYRFNSLKPAMEVLTEYAIACLSGPTKGSPIDGWSIDWKPLFQLTWQEEADLRQKISATDSTYVNMGVLSADEIRQSRFGGAEFGFEVQLLQPQALGKEEAEKKLDELVALTEEMGLYT